MTLMHGDITVESEVGKGSQFTVSFPVNISSQGSPGKVLSSVSQQDRTSISRPRLAALL